MLQVAFNVERDAHEGCRQVQIDHRPGWKLEHVNLHVWSIDENRCGVPYDRWRRA